jgi:hypothetical protein
MPKLTVQNPNTLPVNRIIYTFLYVKPRDVYVKPVDVCVIQLDACVIASDVYVIC